MLITKPHAAMPTSAQKSKECSQNYYDEKYFNEKERHEVGCCAENNAEGGEFDDGLNHKCNG
jgi:hypothetical protein